MSNIEPNIENEIYKFPNLDISKDKKVKRNLQDKHFLERLLSSKSNSLTEDIFESDDPLDQILVTCLIKKAQAGNDRYNDYVIKILEILEKRVKKLAEFLYMRYEKTALYGSESIVS